MEIPVNREDNVLIWTRSYTGKLCVKEVFNVYNESGRWCAWLNKIWQRYIPPKLSVFVWNLRTESLPTEFNAICGGVQTHGGYCVCDNELFLEDQDHLLLRCDYTRTIWNWVSSLLCLDLSFLPTIKEMVR